MRDRRKDIAKRFETLRQRRQARKERRQMRRVRELAARFRLHLFIILTVIAAGVAFCYLASQS